MNKNLIATTQEGTLEKQTWGLDYFYIYYNIIISGWLGHVILSLIAYSFKSFVSLLTLKLFTTRVYIYFKLKKGLITKHIPNTVNLYLLYRETLA